MMYSCSFTTASDITWAQWRPWNSLEINQWMCLWRVKEAFYTSFLWAECFTYIASFPRTLESVFCISSASSQMKKRCCYPWNIYLLLALWLSWELLLSFFAAHDIYFLWEGFLTLPFYLCKVAGFYSCLSQVQHSQSIFFFPLVLSSNILLFWWFVNSQCHFGLHLPNTCIPQQRGNSPNASLAIWHHAPKCFRRLSDANLVPCCNDHSFCSFSAQA